MKKRVLNLSLLMLLSASSNVSAMFKAGSTAFTMVSPAEKAAEKAIETVTDNLDKATSAIANSNEGAVQVALNGVLESAKKLDSISPASLEGKQTTNMIAKFGNLICSLSKNEKLNYLKNAFMTGYSKLANLPHLVKNHPKLTVCLTAASAATAYSLYKHNKGATSSKDLNKDAGIVRGGAAIAHEETGSFGGGAAAEAKHNEIDTPLKAKIDAEIEKIKDVNYALDNGKSLLMRFSEGINANLDAVRYLIEKGANINQQDTSTGEKGRTALAYAAYWGNAPLVEYFLSLDPTLDKSTALKYAQTSKAKKEGNHHSLAHSGTVENYDQIIQLLQS
jgi:hypothetical protein